MDFNKLETEIERNRPLTEMSSLPVAVSNNKIVWCNFYLDEEGDTAVITERFEILDDMSVKKERVSLNVPLDMDNIMEPELGEDEYMSALERLYPSYDTEAMQSLLSKSILGPLKNVYLTIAK